MAGYQKTKRVVDKNLKKKSVVPRSRVNREEIFDLEKYLKLLTSVEKPLQQRLKNRVRIVRLALSSKAWQL